MSFVDRVSKDIDSSIEAIIRDYLPHKRGPLDKFSKLLHYSLFPGGKRFRPALAIAGAEAVGGNLQAALVVGTAIELIHNYSLIHDDLPCMDNSSFRRGKPSAHIQFDEGLAVLAGDALLTDAFVILSDLHKLHGISPEINLNIINLISKCAGSSGMVAGQVLDLKSTSNISFPELEFLAIHKTGKLIYASVVAGALTGNPSKEEMSSLEKYGELIGLVFQIVDDLEDSKVALDQRTPEFPRASFVQIIGFEECRERASELIDQSLNAIKIFGSKGEPLKELATLLRHRLPLSTAFEA